MPSNQPFNFRKRFRRFGRRSLPQIHLATLLVVAGVGLFLAFGVSWLLGNEAIVRWAAAVQQVQLEPPWFVRVPEQPYRPLLLGIFGALLALVLAITTFFPKPNPWTRGIIVGIIIALLIRYILWRVLATLNFNGPWNGMFALALVILEIPLAIPGLLMLFWLPGIRDRTKEANRYEALVKAGDYQPTVDILIPTYNEPERIVRRTIIGCQAVDYPHKVIYVLDDGDRPAIAQLALELGCKYLTRSDRRHAKAGNLNQALQYSQGELIAVFDADFVPTRNFLWRTVGFFSQTDIGLVQSHQNFYNPDPIVRNLGLARYMTVSREDFSRKGQPTLDSIGATICDGSAFVVRRRDLDKIGGFVTESITEDYFSGIMIASRRQRVIYLDENLSAGLAAESLADYISQHHRWLTGNLQGFFIPANPLTVPGLSWRQRLGHLVSLSFWLSSFVRLLILLVPIIGGVTSVFPTLITPNENLYFIVLPLFVQLLSLHWLSERSLSWILFEIVSMVHVIPFSLAALQTLLNPFARGFRVTPKGVYSQKLRLNAWLTLPLGALWLGNGLALAGLGWRIFRGFELSFSGLEREVVSILMFWGVYNLAILGMAILASIDAPRVETDEWFKFERPVLLAQGDRTFTGFTQLASEGGVRIRLAPPVPKLMAGDGVTLEIQSEEWPGTIQLPGEVLKFASQSDIDLKFSPLSGEQHRHLVELLFCRPGQWLRRQHPNELQTAIALVKQVLHPRFARPDEREEDAIPIG